MARKAEVYVGEERLALPLFFNLSTCASLDINLSPIERIVQVERMNMTKVYTHESIVNLQTAKGLLVSNGIDAMIKNEHMGGGGYVGLAIAPLELWVRSSRAAEAKGLLDQAFTHSDEQSAQWVCPDCQEKNFPNFDYCWQCQAAKP